MPRKLRIEYPGAIYHVTARGNGRQAIFRCVGDRMRLLKRLGASLEDYGVRLYLYCLMSNHIHLLVADDKVRGVIPNSIKLIAGRTGQEFN